MFRTYLPDLPKHLNNFKDRLAKSNNETLKQAITISEVILKDYYFEINDDLSLPDLGKMSGTEIEELIQKLPQHKKELEFFIKNKAQIENLRLYIESSDKVNQIAKDFFRKQNS